MRIISHRTIREYSKRNPKAESALEAWYKTTSKANWTCFADMKKDFNSVDSVGNQRYVFNIKGNDYRLVVIVRFVLGTVFIRFIGTHQEYDKIKDIQNI